MPLNLHFSAYWLLIPLAVGLFAWAVAPRSDEYGGYLPDMGVLVRLAAAVFIFLAALVALLALNLWHPITPPPGVVARITADRPMPPALQTALAELIALAHEQLTGQTAPAAPSTETPNP